MIQTESRTVQSLPARRVSAEEFGTLVRQDRSGVYRPRWEVARMLAVGQAWGACAEDGTLETVLLVLPLEADVSLCAGLRALQGALLPKGFVLTPPAGSPSGLPRLLKAAKNSALRRAPASPVQAILEPGTQAEEAVLGSYLAAGFSLRAMRPLQSMVPLALLSTAPVNTTRQDMWVPFSDATHLALLLEKGWAAVEKRNGKYGCQLRLVPLYGPCGMAT